MYAPWCFPEAWIVAIPVAGVWLAHLLLTAEHLCHLRVSSSFEFRFQALWVRVIGVIPLMAVISMLGAFYPWGSPAVDFSIAFVEAYIIACFLAIIFGFGWAAGIDVPNALLQGTYTRSPGCCAAPFVNADNCFAWWKWNVLQFCIVKPFCMLIIMLYVLRNKVPAPGQLVVIMRLIAAVSIIRAVISLLGAYSALRWHEKQPMGNHKVFRKLVVIKVLFGFIVLNFLIINSLVTYRNIPVDPWLCSYATQNSNVTFATSFSSVNHTGLVFCQERLTNTAFVFELAIVGFPATLLFRHFAFAETEESSGASAPALRFLFYTIYPFDLPAFWNGTYFGALPSRSMVAAEKA